MNKFIALFAPLFFVGAVYAANVSIRLEEPKSPTNQNSFSVGFVALDIAGRPITVNCFKKGPADAGFIQVGSTINLSSGGNSGNCSLQSSHFNGDGGYLVKVEAQAGGDSATDQIGFTYDSSGPGDPRDYNKTKPSSCVYNIHFKTADDSGATAKVEIYRSENTSFTADNGTRVGTVVAGSNETKDFPDTVPNCDKTYYYVTRAFDSAGNGSGLVGDSVITTIVNPTTTTQQTVGAIPVNTGTGGNVLGQETGATAATQEGQVEGTSDEASDEAAMEASKASQSPILALFQNKLFDLGLLSIGVLAFLLWRKQKNMG